MKTAVGVRKRKKCQQQSTTIPSNHAFSEPTRKMFEIESI
jgi:hypothetical protein